MNDERKTKKQLLQDLALAQGRIELERERAIALQDVSNKVAGAYDVDEVLHLIVNEAARLLGTTGAWMRVIEAGVLVPGATTESAAPFIAEIARLQPAIPVGEQSTVQGRVMATKKPFVWVSGDPVAEGAITSAVMSTFEKFGYQSVLSVPLLANDRSIGTLNVLNDQVYRFTEDEISLLMAFASQAALALDKARLLSEAEIEKERSDALYRVSNLLAGAHDTDEVLGLIVNESARLLGGAGA